MTYEVEQKFPVDDLATLEEKLATLGANVLESHREVDLYYAHPARDFAVTDEALRIRRVGLTSCITYKGPKVDATTKTRREIELPLPAEVESGSDWKELLEALGFSPVAEVRKERRKATIPWQGRRIIASLDDVEQLGTFLELELTAVVEDLGQAKACIASLADALGLSKGERRSYLELLLAGR